MRDAIRVYLELNGGHEAVDFLEDMCEPLFLARLAYMVDMFAMLNELNTDLQVSNIDRLTAINLVKAFIATLSMIRALSQKQKLSYFKELKIALDNLPDDPSVKSQLKRDIDSHIDALLISFNQQFSGHLDIPQWIINPMGIDIITDEQLAQESVSLKGEHVQMRHCPEAQNKFSSAKPIDAWLAQLSKFPIPAKKALENLIPFATTYKCEQGFSTMKAIKNVYRSSLIAMDEMRLLESTTKPDIETIVEGRREYSSPGSVRFMR